MSAIATATAQALMHFLWQGALVGLAAWGVLSFLEKARPSTRYAVATAALLLLAALPFATLFQMAGGAPPPVEVPVSIAPASRCAVLNKGSTRSPGRSRSVSWCVFGTSSV